MKKKLFPLFYTLEHENGFYVNYLSKSYLRVLSQYFIVLDFNF